MIKNLKRSVKRAEKYLEFINKFIKDYENTLKNHQILDWLISNSDLMQQEMETFYYGKDSFESNNWKIYKDKYNHDIKQIIKKFPDLIELSKKFKKGSYYDSNYNEAFKLSKIIRKHLLKYIQRAKEEIEDKELESIKLKEKFKELNPDLILQKYALYLHNSLETRTFIKNYKSLLRFEQMEEYKYCMIAMGSIIEFLLKRYCEFKNINPIPPKDKRFVKYVELAIQNKIFGDKKYWELVQSHLRDLRNYVHIQKEVSNPELDYNWYKIIHPVFEKLIKEFQIASAEELTP